VTNLPKSDWMSLKSAFDFVSKETQQPQGEVKETIRSALRDEELLSRGRCLSYKSIADLFDLEYFLWDHPEIDWSISSFQFPRNDSDQRKNNYHQVTEVQIRRTGNHGVENWLGSSSNEISDLAYIPPFLNFMLKTVSALHIDGSERIPLDDIKHWIEENWNDELGKPSGNIISQMATLIRRPEDRKGGNHQQRVSVKNI
jgi:hypothetical protein